MANTLSLMTNVLRNAVSKQRIRYTENGFNLDLAYIRDNIIAMGYPADNYEGIYRNRIDDVYQFFEGNHRDHYKIYNLCSERSYDISKFHGRVAIYPFDDHNPPTIELIQKFCDDVDRWLKADKFNVAAVHCKAGKGRTGTMICCYLLHCGFANTAEEALAFYDEKRTKDKKGVTIPSQRRYVNYYSKLIRSGKQYERKTLQICEIKFSAPLQLHSQGTVHCSISSLQDQTYGEKQKILHTFPIDFRKSQSIDIIKDRCIPLVGDVKIEVYHKVMRKKDKYFHFWFNTYLVCEEAEYKGDADDIKLVYELSKYELDDAHKDKEHKNFPEDFKVQIILKPVPSRNYNNLLSNTAINENSHTNHHQLISEQLQNQQQKQQILQQQPQQHQYHNQNHRNHHDQHNIQLPNHINHSKINTQMISGTKNSSSTTNTNLPPATLIIKSDLSSTVGGSNSGNFLNSKVVTNSVYDGMSSSTNNHNQMSHEKQNYHHKGLVENIRKHNYYHQQEKLQQQLINQNQIKKDYNNSDNIVSPVSDGEHYHHQHHNLQQQQQLLISKPSTMNPKVQNQHTPSASSQDVVSRTNNTCSGSSSKCNSSTSSNSSSSSSSSSSSISSEASSAVGEDWESGEFSIKSTTLPHVDKGDVIVMMVDDGDNKSHLKNFQNINSCSSSTTLSYLEFPQIQNNNNNKINKNNGNIVSDNSNNMCRVSTGLLNLNVNHTSRGNICQANNSLITIESDRINNSKNKSISNTLLLTGPNFKAKSRNIQIPGGNNFYKTNNFKSKNMRWLSNLRSDPDLCETFVKSLSYRQKQQQQEQNCDVFNNIIKQQTNCSTTSTTADPDDFYSCLCDTQLSFGASPCKSPPIFSTISPSLIHRSTPISLAEKQDKHNFKNNNLSKITINDNIVIAKPIQSHSIGFNVILHDQNEKIDVKNKEQQELFNFSGQNLLANNLTNKRIKKISFSLNNDNNIDDENSENICFEENNDTNENKPNNIEEENKCDKINCNKLLFKSNNSKYEQNSKSSKSKTILLSQADAVLQSSSPPTKNLNRCVPFSFKDIGRELQSVIKHNANKTKNNRINNYCISSTNANNNNINNSNNVNDNCNASGKNRGSISSNNCSGNSSNTSNGNSKSSNSSSNNNNSNSSSSNSIGTINTSRFSFNKKRKASLPVKYECSNTKNNEDAN